MAIPGAQGAYGAQGPSASGSNAPNPAARARAYASSTYGQQLSDDDLNQLAGAVGWDPTQGGPSEAHYAKAKSLIDQRFKKPSGGGGGGAPAPTPSPSPPPGYRPSVNRDGSIPEPAVLVAKGGPAPAPAPAAPSAAPAAGNAQSFTGVDPNTSFDPNAALQELQKQIGRPLSAAELEEAKRLVGWDGGNLTGEQLNSLLQTAQSRTPGSVFTPFAAAPAAAPAPAPTDAAGWEAFLRSRLTAGQTLPTTELPTYQAQTFEDPTDPAVRENLNNLLNEILQNPESMGPGMVAALKEAQKEQILATSEQQQAELMQNAASRGTYGGGNMASRLRRNADARVGDLARSGREIDIASAATNAADRRAAAALGEGALQGQFSRGFQTAGFNAGERGKQFQSEADKVNFALSRALSQAGLNQNDINAALQAWQVGTQRDLGEGGLDLDRDRLEEQGRQFDSAHNLDWIRTLNDMIMGRADYGLDLAQLQQGGQNSIFDWMFGGRG